MALAFEDFARIKIASRNFIRNVVRRARTNLTQKDMNVNKDLYNSLEGNFEMSALKQEITFSYEIYGEYQDAGIRGWKSAKRAPDSPFQYKKKMANSKAIEGWVKNRRFQFRTKKGTFMSYESTAFLIARSIAAKGIKATKWFTEAFDKYFNNFVIDFSEKLARDTEDFLIKNNGNNSNIQ